MSQNVAARVRSSVRDFDSVGRYGGEEVLVIFDNCDAAHSRAIAERIRGDAEHRSLTFTDASAPHQPLIEEAD